MKRNILFLLISLSNFCLIAQNTLIIGQGTTSSTHFGPFYRSHASSSFNSSNYVYLYSASELDTLPKGAIITGIAWHKVSAETLTGNNYFEIKLENTNQSEIIVSGNNYNNETTGMKTVYTDIMYTVPIAGGWLEHTLDSTFQYNGESLKIGCGHLKNGVASGAIHFRYEDKPGMAAGVASNSGTNVMSFNTQHSNRRPNIRLTYTFPSIQHDAGIKSIDNLADTIIPGIHDVFVRLSNIGQTNLSSTTVNWSVNDVVQTPFTWAGSLSQGHFSSSFSIGSFSFAPGNQKVKVWTSLPNNQTDEYNGNDTLEIQVYCIAPFSGVYTVGGVGADFLDMHSVIDSLTKAGVSGNVVFNFLPNTGPFNGGVTLGKFKGVSDTSRITLNGNQNILLKGSANYVIELNNADNITIQGFKMLNTSPNTAFYGIIVRGESEFLKIADNYINAQADTGFGIALSASLSTPGSYGSNGRYITIENNTIENIAYGISIMGDFNGGYSRGHIVRNNIVKNTRNAGIGVFSSDTVVIYNNIITNPDVPNHINSDYYGIRLQTSMNVKVISNKLFDFTKIFNDLYLIHVEWSNQNSLGFEIDIINNAIYDIRANSFTAAIFLKLSNYINIYHNTVRITPLSSSSSNKNRGLYVDNLVSNLNVVNNIFYIAPTSGITYNSQSGIFLMYQVTGFYSDYNCFYMSSPQTTNFSNYTPHNYRTSLSAWQSTTSQDSNSIVVNPVFLSDSTFRHKSYDLYQKGIPIAGVSFDIDGEPRDTIAPCIGADEYIFHQNDASVEELISICMSNSPVLVKVRNAGLSPLTSLSINWSVDNVVQNPVTFSLNLTYQQDTVLSIGTYPFVLQQSYNLRIWSFNPNNTVDENPDNDTLDVSNVIIKFEGVITVGRTPAHDYQCIKTALQAVKSLGMCGPLTIDVDSAGGPYSGGIIIDNLPGMSSINTLTFQGNGSTIIKDTASFIVNINATSHVKFINFQLINPVQTSSGVGVMICCGAQDIEISDCYIDMGIEDVNSIGIAVSGSDTGMIAGANGPNINIVNNEIVGGTVGINVSGDNTSNLIYLNIENNIIRDFFTKGINLLYCDSLTISGNEISRKYRNINGNFQGVSTLHSSNVEISQNRIFSIGNGIFDADIFYFYLCAGQTRLINNEISDIANNGLTYGVHAFLSNNIFIHHNTFAFDGNSNGDKIFYNALFSNNVNVRNNIFSQPGIGSGLRGVYKVQDFGMGNPALTFNSNNNVYYMDFALQNTYFCQWVSTTYTLTNWRATTNLDTNSIVANPFFADVYNHNLKPLSAQIDNIGQSLGVPYDIRGRIRSTTTPDPGAIEFDAVSSDIALINASILPELCLSYNDTLELTILNTIGQTVDFSINPLVIVWEVTGPVNSSDSIVISGDSLGLLESMTIRVGGVNLSEPGAYSLLAYLKQNPSNLYQGNDTLYQFNDLIKEDHLTVQPAFAVVLFDTIKVNLNAFSPYFPPLSSNIPGFTWSYSGAFYSSNPDTMAGPFQVNGLHKFIAEYHSSCGVHSDTVNILAFVEQPVLYNDTTICSGDSIRLLSSIPGVAPWTVVIRADGLLDTITVTNIEELRMSPLLPTLYTVESFKDSFGIFRAVNDSILINVNSAPTVSISGLLDTICINHVIILDAGSGFLSYLWSNGDTTQITEIVGSVYGYGQKSFSVVAVDANYCKGYDTVRIFIHDCTGINDDNPDGYRVSVYPNPSDGIIKLEIQGMGNKTGVEILNSSGQLIMSESFNPKTYILREYDISFLPAGIYILRVTGEDRIISRILIFN